MIRSNKQAEKILLTKATTQGLINQEWQSAHKELEALRDLTKDVETKLKFLTFKKHMNQILIGLFLDAGLKPNKDYRVNNCRFYLDDSDALQYKGYAQKNPRLFDITDPVQLKFLEGHNILESEFMKLIEQGRAKQEEHATRIKKYIDKEKPITIKIDTPLKVTSRSYGALEAINIKQLDFKLTSNRFSFNDTYFSLYCSIGVTMINKSGGEDIRSFDFNQELLLYPKYRQAVTKIMKRAEKELQKMIKDIDDAEQKIINQTPERYATYVFLNKIKK